MGTFVGGAAGFLLVFAGICAVVIFLEESGVLKKGFINTYKKPFFFGITAAVVQLALYVYTANCLKGQINFMNFETLFSRSVFNDALFSEKIVPSEAFIGGAMPLYMIAVRLFGRLCFEKYAEAAVFISILSTGVLTAAAADILKKIMTENTAGRAVGLLFFLPYTLFFQAYPFAPAIAMTLIAISLALDRKKKSALVWGVLSMLTGWIGAVGIAAALLIKACPNKKIAVFESNNAAFYTVFTVLVLAVAAVMLYQAGGIVK